MSFKNLKVWQRAMDLCRTIYRITSNFPDTAKFGLISQMRRCSISIPSNIAEGSQRVSDKDFSNFVLISKGSLAELETQVELSSSLGYINQEQTERIIQSIGELHKMLYALHQKLVANR